MHRLHRANLDKLGRCRRGAAVRSPDQLVQRGVQFGGQARRQAAFRGPGAHLVAYQGGGAGQVGTAGRQLALQIVNELAQVERHILTDVVAGVPVRDQMRQAAEARLAIGRQTINAGQVDPAAGRVGRGRAGSGAVRDGDPGCRSAAPGAGSPGRAESATGG